MKRYITLTAAGAALAAGLLAATIVGSAPDEVSGQPVAAPTTDTVLPEPEPYVDDDSVIHVPGPPGGPADPECQELAAKRAAAREAGVPVIKVPTELMRCDPHTFR